MRVLITGGAGFLGSHLVERLVKDGYNVTVLDNFTSGCERNLRNFSEKIKLIRMDICNPEIISLIKGMDIIFHLAAIPEPRSCDEHKEQAFKCNVIGTFNIMYVASKYNVNRVVFMSTAHLYGEPKYLPIDENHPIDTYNYYTFTKRIGEELCDFFHKFHSLKVIYFRLFNAYGPRQRPNFLIPTLILGALKHGEIRIWSGKPSRDFIFVDDVIEALVKSIDIDFISNPINLGYHHEVNVGELAKFIASLLNSKLLIFDRKVEGPMRMICDNTKAKKLLNWEPKVDLREGLERTIKWYKENLEM